MKESEIPNKADFKKQLKLWKDEAARDNKGFLEITSKELHLHLGGYPNGGNHAMPACCDVMRESMSFGDDIINEPSNGKGATLKIKYYL